MVDERKGVCVEAEYLRVIGEAAYCFACLEWNAAWCLEKLDEGFLADRDQKKFTAGKLANLLVVAAGNLGEDQPYKTELQNASGEFVRLVDVRNRILHGTPHTDESNEQRLGYKGHTWTPESIEQASDAFTVCSMKLNHLLHRELSRPSP